MTKPTCPAGLWLVGVALGFLSLGSYVFAAEAPAETSGEGPPEASTGQEMPSANSAQPDSAEAKKPAAKRKPGGAGPADPPPYYKSPPKEIEVPSVVRGRKAGVEVGQYAPDFQLQPIEPYPSLEDWLGPETVVQRVRPRPVVTLVRSLRGRRSGLLPGRRARAPRSVSLGRYQYVTRPPDLLNGVRLSRLVGKAPILLLYGSYT